jgi:2-polyprenyl-3-methyl-5-hydroxy-6-metoxy-1,4-benzoquinol methylase
MGTADLFEDYHDACFKLHNKFSEQEYERQYIDFKNNYADILPGDKKARILDVGSGAGHFLYCLKKAGYDNYLGIDISKQQVDYCRQNVSEKAEQVDAEQFLKSKNDYYDFIMTNFVLEHVPKEKTIEFLKSIFASLKKGGALSVKVPNMGNPLALRARYVDFTHTIGFTEKSLYQVLWMSGFRDVEIRPFKQSGLANKACSAFIGLVIKKLMWYQGFVAPKIITPVLIGVARK